MKIFSISINGKTHEVNADPSTPMLWVLRDHLDMTGTKFGCGIAKCGACTVHLCTLDIHLSGHIINES